MRNKLRRLAVLGMAAVLFSACEEDSSRRLQVSLYPLAGLAEEDEKLRVFEPALLGRWTSGKESGPTRTFTRESENDGGYEVEIADGDATVKLYAWLIRLDDTVFITFCTQEIFDFSPSFYAAHMFQAFSFGVLSVDGDTVQLRMLDSVWVEAAAGDGTLPIAHVLRGSEGLLTASGEELREFARVHATDEQAFGAVTTLTRATGQPAGDR